VIRHTDTLTDRETHDDRINRASIASRGKKIIQLMNSINFYIIITSFSLLNLVCIIAEDKLFLMA